LLGFIQYFFNFANENSKAFSNHLVFHSNSSLSLSFLYALIAFPTFPQVILPFLLTA
jgi:hypothetical protein